MKLIPLTCAYLKQAKRAIISNQYLFLLTGKSIIILNKKWEYIKTIEGLKYAYNGVLSPDETKLLVISNEPVCYIISLDTLDMVNQCRMRGSVVGIEGQGAWSLDSQSVKIITMNKQNTIFSIRTYFVADTHTFEEDVSLGNLFQLYAIVTTPSEKSTFVLARRRMTSMTATQPHSLSLLRYDEGGVGCFEIEKQTGTPLSMEYNERMKRFVIYTTENSFTCDLEGKNIREIDTGTPPPKNSQMLFSMPFIIKQIVESINGRYLYVASTGGIDIFNYETGELIYHKSFSYGLEGITEIEDSCLIVNLYGGSSKLYKIQE